MELDDPGNPMNVHSVGLRVSGEKDRHAWRLLAREVKRPAYERLEAWRAKHEAGLPGDEDSRIAVVDEAVNAVSGLIALGLTGVASERKWFADQRSIFDALVNVPGWNWAGREATFTLPWTLGYVYHTLHGALCLRTAQLDRALRLADMPIRDARGSEFHRPWTCRPVIGWSCSLGNSCVETARFIRAAFGRWPWLVEFFGTEAEYRESLVAYYLLLNIRELAARIASNDNFVEEIDGASGSGPPRSLAVPLDLVHEHEREILDGGLLLLLRCDEQLPNVWRRDGVSREQMEAAWPGWMKLCRAWLANIHPSGFLRDDLPHERLFEILPSTRS